MTLDYPSIIFIAILIGVYVGYLFSELYKMKKVNKAQIELLAIIARKQGASKEEIDKILNKIYPKKEAD